MKKNTVLLVLVIVFAAMPLFFFKGAYEGSDDMGTGEIAKIKPDYKPWFSPLWTPPSSEIESLLFSLQTGLGAGFMGYYFGYIRGKKAKK